jgi:hypothetical protein
VNAVAILTEVTPVATVTNNQTPSYIFNSSTGWTIAYTGPCNSTTTLATAGNNTIIFNSLSTEMLYSTCQVSVDDGGGPSSPLNISSFTLDISVPTISVIQSNITINVNDPYPTWLANWSDTFPVGPGGTLVGTGFVDKTTVGVYTLTFDYTDSAGNMAVQKTRTINVVNGNKPVLTLVGPALVQVASWSVYIDSGATATDIEDDAVPIALVVTTSGTVDTNTVGSYTLTYHVTDSAGNTATPITRNVNVLNGNIPIITLSGSSTILHEQGTPYVDPGATGNDIQDGPITSTSRITSSGVVGTGTTGTYFINYNLIDLDWNPAVTVTRTVIVADRTAPTIAITGSASVNVMKNTLYSDSGATWSDLIDGTGGIVGSGTVNTNIPGIYTITYNRTDAAGNMATTVTRTANVITGAIPVITLIGSGVVNILMGSVYTESGATAFDTEDLDITASGSMSWSVNTSIPGVYILTYSVTDSNNNTVTQIRTVNVLDTIPPVITLIGSGNITISAGSAYTDAGATWTDNVDGSGTLVAGGVVNINVAGLYILSYNYTDSYGNIGTLARRNVTVVALTSVPSTGMVGWGGGAWPGSSISSANGMSFNSAPSNSNSTSNNLLVSSIHRLLKRSKSPEMNSATESHNTQNTISKLNVIDPITDYICPVVEKLYDANNANIANVSEGEYTDDVRSLLMYRGLDSKDLSTNFTQRYFINKWFGIAKINEAYDGTRAITRAEFIKMLVRSLSCHYTYSEEDQGFSDIGTNAWYTEYVNFATANGWISGYNNGTFGPHNLITRGEMAKILGQAIHIETDNTTTESFYDVPVSHPFAPFIYALKNNGIMDGKTELFFDMNSNVSRNEVARIINKTFLKIKNK